MGATEVGGLKGTCGGPGWDTRGTGLFPLLEGGPIGLRGSSRFLGT